MLLQQIIERLDAELDRLQRLREIVAGLKGSPVLVVPFADEVEAVEPEAGSFEVEVQRLPPRLPRERRTRVRSSGREKEHSALSSAIPARPVVVSADALARETAARKKVDLAQPKVAEGTLGAMIRALRQQGAV